MPGVSNRALAPILGISESAVCKARTGRLKGAVLPDGTLDIEKAKWLYAGNTDPTKQRDRPVQGTRPAAAPALPDTDPAPAPAPLGGRPEAGSVDLQKARAFQIFENAKITQIKRRKLEGTAIERGPTKALVQTLARTTETASSGSPTRAMRRWRPSSGSNPSSSTPSSTPPCGVTSRGDRPHQVGHRVMGEAVAAPEVLGVVSPSQLAELIGFAGAQEILDA